MENETAEQKKERLNIEESREKRLDRIKAKQRDRGGIFQPREENPFLDILMSRDVSGRSPTKPKPKARRSSAAPSLRDITPTPRKTMGGQANGRRKYVAADVAGKQRQRSTTPLIDAERPSGSRTAERKTNVSNISKSSSKRSEELITPKGKSTAPRSKRPRDNSDEQLGAADLPSPPKRLKKSATSTAPPSTSAPKPDKSARKATSKSKTIPKTKAGPSASASKQRDENDEDDEVPVAKIKQASTPKKRGKTKKYTNQLAGAGKNSGSSRAEGPSTSKTKEKASPAAKTNSRSKPKATQSTNRRTKKDSNINVNDERTSSAPARGKARTKAEGKKKVEPDSEPASEPEVEEVVHSRTKFPKPRLDAVMEEDEKELEEENRDVEREQDSSSGNSSRTLVEAPSRGSLKDKNPKRQHAATEFEDAEIAPDKATKGPKKVATDRKTGLRSKESTDIIEEEPEVKRTMSKAVRKNKSTASSSKPKAPSAPRAKAKPKSKSKSATSKTKPSLLAQKPTFANLKTTVFSSPIKATTNDADEIDFL